MNKILVLVLIVSAFILGYNRFEVKYSEIEKIRLLEINNTKTVYNQTCVNVSYVTVYRDKYVIHNISFGFNITGRQVKQIKNLKPEICYTIGCSEGYIKCKYDVYDVLGVEHPKFSERPSTGYNPFKEKTNESILVRQDGFGRYLNLSDREWYVMGGVKSYNLSFICDGNNTWQTHVDRTEDGWYNITYNHTTDDLRFDNMSEWMPKQILKNLMIRHV
jgi:hypothetical protein